MQLFIEQLINGCALGALYALFGLGFGIVFSTLGILNAAHGSYASWAAIAALAAVEQLKLPFLPALVVGVVGGGLLAVVVDQIAFQPLRKRGSGMLGALITSIAFWIILDNLAGTATGQQSLSFPRGSYPGTMFHLGDIPIPAMQLITVAVMLVVTFGLHILIRRSRFGAAMRAVGWNRQPALCRDRHRLHRRCDFRPGRRSRWHHHAQRFVPAWRGPAAQGVRRGGGRRLRRRSRHRSRRCRARCAGGDVGAVPVVGSA